MQVDTEEEKRTLGEGGPRRRSLSVKEERERNEGRQSGAPSSRRRKAAASSQRVPRERRDRSILPERQKTRECEGEGREEGKEGTRERILLLREGGDIILHREGEAKRSLLVRTTTEERRSKEELKQGKKLSHLSMKG